MLQKFLIWVVVFAIILFLISRCGTDKPEPTVTIDGVSQGINDLSGSAKDAAGSALDAAGNAVGSAGSAVGDLAGSAKDAAGNVVGAAGDLAGSAKDAAGNVVGAAGDLAGSAKDAAGNVVGAAGDFAGSAKDAAGNAVGAASDLAGSAKDAAGNAVGAAGNAIGSASTSTAHRATNTIDKLSTLSSESGSNLVLDGVTFKFNSIELENESFSILNAVADKLSGTSNQVEIAGYTDNIGSDSKNEKISQMRADTVVKYLVGKGIDAGRLTAKGYGSASPVADNSTKTGRHANRRVELQVK